MSLDIFENQITGLLGHNGAGKVKKKFLEIFRLEFLIIALNLFLFLDNNYVYALW